MLLLLVYAVISFLLFFLSCPCFRAIIQSTSLQVFLLRREEKHLRLYLKRAGVPGDETNPEATVLVCPLPPPPPLKENNELLQYVPLKPSVPRRARLHVLR